jgi:hypothetical protein
MKTLLLAIGTLVYCLASFPAAAQARASASLCKEFQLLLAMPYDKGILQRQLSGSFGRGAKEDADDHYFNLDIDGDDIEDVVTLGCSHSSEPSDPCMLDIELSSGGKIAFEEWKFFLVRHKGKIYAVSAEFGPNRKKGGGKIFAVGPRSVKEICYGL